MKVLKYMGAAVLTVLLLLSSRLITVTQPVDHIISGGSMLVKHTTMLKIIDGTPDRVPITIQNPDNINMSVHFNWVFSKDNLPDNTPYNIIKMMSDEDNKDTYIALMPSMGIGKIIFYYIDIQDSTGKQIARIPADENRLIKLKYMGAVPGYIILPHVILMFATIFFASLALFDSVKVISGKPALSLMAKNYLLATIIIFLGGGPFGWAMNYYAFGCMWEAIPFGWDFTDNKTQIVFFYLIFLVLSMPGTLLKRKPEENNFSDKTMGWFGVVGYLLVLTIYIIPHSIQFSIPTTALFAYGLTILILILYIIGIIGRNRWTTQN